MVIWNLVGIRPKSFPIPIPANLESFPIRFQKNLTISKTVRIKWYSVQKWLEFVPIVFIPICDRLSRMNGMTVLDCVNGDRR
jgi:hypothetical protein